MIKRLIQICAGLLLAAMFGYPLLGAWLERHPESEMALSGAASLVDKQAGVFTQGGQFVRGVAKSRELLDEEKREQAEDKANAEIERKEAARRRFNSGDTTDQDSYSDY